MTDFDVGIGTQDPDRKLDVQEKIDPKYAARIQGMLITGSGLQIVCDDTTSSNSYIFTCEKELEQDSNNNDIVGSNFPFTVKGNGRVGMLFVISIKKLNFYNYEPSQDEKTLLLELFSISTY